MQQFEKVQLKIFYYFMLADGKCTEGEKKMFDSICSTLNIKAEEKNEIVSICELAVTEQSRDNSEGIIQIIKNLCQEETGSFLRRTVKEKIRNDWKLKKRNVVGSD